MARGLKNNFLSFYSFLLKKPHWYLVISLPVQDGLPLAPPLAIPTSHYPEIYIKLRLTLKQRTIYGLEVKQLLS